MFKWFFNNTSRQDNNLSVTEVNDINENLSVTSTTIYTDVPSNTEVKSSESKETTIEDIYAVLTTPNKNTEVKVVGQQEEEFVERPSESAAHAAVEAIKKEANIAYLEHLKQLFLNTEFYKSQEPLEQINLLTSLEIIFSALIKEYKL